MLKSEDLQFLLNTDATKPKHFPFNLQLYLKEVKSILPTNLF